MNYSINVLIVTYRQENVIGRTIDSILQQKEFGLNEIVICDDCSPDNNWEVIKSYQARFPNIIRAYRNENNLGIYGNSNKLVSLRGNSELYYWLEGDDALCDGAFKSIQEYIERESIELSNACGFFLDWKTIRPDGQELISSNRAVTANKSPFSLYIRNIVSWRGAFFTAAVINQFSPVDVNNGLNLAEGLFDSQWFRYVKHLYHIDALGAIYYSGIGISTEISDLDSDYNTLDAIGKWLYFRDHFANNWRDKMWLNSRIKRIECVMQPSWGLFFKSVFYYILGVYYNKRCFKKGDFVKFVYPIYKSTKKMFRGANNS